MASYQTHPRIKKKICNDISKGTLVENAILRAGICRATWTNWKTRGRKEKTGIYADFLAAIKKAQADFESIYLNEIGVAARSRKAHPNWTAAAWLLERCFPERYGRKTQAIQPPEKKKTNGNSVLDSVERVCRRMAEADEPPRSD